MEVKLNPKEFSISEALSDSNGKTSGSKLGSMIALIVGSLSLILNSISILFVDPDISQSLALVAGTSSAVIMSAVAGLGYSKKFSKRELNE